MDTTGSKVRRRSRKLGITRKKQEQHLEQVKGKHEEINKQMADLRSNIQNLRQVINQWHNQASELHIEKEIISKELAVREERFRSLTDQIHAYEVGYYTAAGRNQVW